MTNLQVAYIEILRDLYKISHDINSKFAVIKFRKNVILDADKYVYSHQNQFNNDFLLCMCYNISIYKYRGYNYAIQFI